MHTTTTMALATRVVLESSSLLVANASSLQDSGGDGGGMQTAAMTTSGGKSLPTQLLVALLCAFCVLFSFAGNSLVVSVIIQYKRLKNPTNYILLSLAIADLTVSLLVMIPAMIQDVLDRWIFNSLFCLMYNAFDITCCTASILHLLLVAIDRYIAIFKPLKYRETVRTWHVFVSVILVWTLSFCMSFLPIFLGWNKLSAAPPTPSSTNATEIIFNHTIAIGESENNNNNNNNSERCVLEANIPYSIISSSLSFFIPVLVMSVLYLQIYRVARRQAKAIARINISSRKMTREASSAGLPHVTTTGSMKDTLANAASSAASAHTCHKDQKMLNQLLISTNDLNAMKRGSTSIEDKKGRFVKLMKQLKVIEKKRNNDTKAIKTLLIIMGLFIISWLPFFLLYLIVPLADISVPHLVDRIITWIGYTNSFINPIVYALTNKDFRKAYVSTFKAIGKKVFPSSFYYSTIGKKEVQFYDLNKPRSSGESSKSEDCACLGGDSCLTRCFSSSSSSPSCYACCCSSYATDTDSEPRTPSKKSPASSRPKMRTYTRRFKHHHHHQRNKSTDAYLDATTTKSDDFGSEHGSLRFEVSPNETITITTPTLPAPTQHSALHKPHNHTHHNHHHYQPHYQATSKQQHRVSIDCEEAIIYQYGGEKKSFSVDSDSILYIDQEQSSGDIRGGGETTPRLHMQPMAIIPQPLTASSSTADVEVAAAVTCESRERRRESTKSVTIMVNALDKHQQQHLPSTSSSSNNKPLSLFERLMMKNRARKESVIDFGRELELLNENLQDIKDIDLDKHSNNTTTNSSSKRNSVYSIVREEQQKKKKTAKTKTKRRTSKKKSSLTTKTTARQRFRRLLSLTRKKRQEDDKNNKLNNNNNNSTVENAAKTPPSTTNGLTSSSSPVSFYIDQASNNTSHILNKSDSLAQ